jgi:tetratricopeptide (TPR) repeat protein
VKYSAFISYNHRDRKIAGWLHHALETYRVPKALWGRESPIGVLSRRLPPVFQDREELAASTDLAASVLEALEQSACLIVICTPNGRRSRWVNEEIRTFTRMGRRDRIQCLIAGGEPNASNVPGMDPELEALPPALFENGETEPLGADIRDGQDGKLSGKLKLLAGLLNVRYDELRQREAARRQRQLAVVAAGSVAGFVAMSGLTAAALVQRAEAIRQRDIAREKTLTAERTVGFVKSIFTVADPSEARGATITAREILDRGAASIDRGLAREPTVKAELGTTLGEVYTNLGLLHDGDQLIRKMLRVQGVAPATRARQYLVLAESSAWLADDAGAAAAFRQALALAEHPKTGRPDLVPRILSGLGTSQTYVGDMAAGEANIRRAIHLDTIADPAGLDLARDLEALGLNQLMGERFGPARAALDRAVAIRTRLQGADHPLAVQDLNSLGYAAYMEHDSATAERLWRRTLLLDERLFGPNHPEVAVALNNVALIMVERRQYGAAEPLLRRAVAINLEQRDDKSSELVFEYTNLGIARRGLGDAREGEADLDKALTAARLHKHRNLAPILVNLADIACDRGDVAAGTARLDEAAPIMASAYPKDPWRQAWVQVVRGNCLTKAGRPVEALRTLRSAEPAMRARWSPESHYGARLADLMTVARRAS